MKKFTVFTIGCRTNIAESEKLKAILISKEFEYTPLVEDADYIFLNTCTVTHKADRDSKKIFNRIKRLNKRAKIYITGCALYLFKDENQAKILSFKDLLEEFNGSNENIEVLPPYKSGHSRYFLKIQEGCDYKCSFCIVPFRRGKSRSYDISTLLKETELAVSKGYKEIVLTGTQIGDYGKDLEPPLSLRTLLEKLITLNLDFRIRLSSLHPSHIYKIYDYLTEEKVVPHLHIPLQSASEKVLRDMKRPYTIKFYGDILNSILKLNRRFSIGTDLIIGFPTENREEFLETKRYIENSPFSYIHIFSYSKRKGTESSKLKEIDKKELKERMEVIKEIDKKKREKFLNSLLGNILKPVYEKEERGFLMGLSEYGVKVKFKGNGIKRGEVVNVYVNEVDNLTLSGYKI